MAPILIAFRLPVEHAVAVAFHLILAGRNQRGQHRVAGSAFGPGHAHFAEHRFLAVGIEKVVDVHDELLHILPPVARFGIERQADQVVLQAALFAIVEEPVELGFVLPLVDVDHHVGLGEDFLRSGIAGVVQFGIVAEAQIGIVLPGRPEHAARGLVADLDPGRRDAGLLQGVQHVAGMIGHGVAQLRQREILPCGRLVLLARIGPGIAVVEVNHDLHAQILGANGLGHHVFLPAPSAFRIDPHAKPDGIYAETLEQRHAFHLTAVARPELAPVVLHLRHPAHIRPPRHFQRLRLRFRLGFRLRPITAAGHQRHQATYHQRSNQ